MGFDVWCPLFFVGVISVLLWILGIKNLVRPVRPGKPYAALCMDLVSQALDGGAGAMKPVPWHVSTVQQELKQFWWRRVHINSNERGS